MNTGEEMELALDMCEEESCTFITSNLLEQTENFEEWLNKNGVQCILTNDLLQENMISNQLDPLLNQINVIDNFSDSENAYTTEYDSQESLEDKSKFETLISKSVYLEELLLNGLNVELTPKENKIFISLSDNENKAVKFPKIYISLSNGQISIAKQKVAVKSVEKVSIAKDLKAVMPCLHLETGLRLYVCPKQDCDIVFTKSGAAKMHALIQIGHKTFKCEYPGCTWAFYNSFKLRRHQDSHSNKKDFTCVVKFCGRKFTNVYNLNIHMRNHSRPAILPCAVKSCPMKFQTSRQRDKHFKTHDISEAPYLCPQKNCNRAFFLHTGLSSHARMHSHKDSEIRCDYPNCGKVFEQPCRLKEHMRKHTGQRPYICMYEACKWSFTTASKLKRHQSTHTRERKFHCTIGSCNKSFLRSEHLKEHTLTHIGSRSFQCEVCSANFFGKSSLYLHIKKVHPEKSQNLPKQIEKKPTAEMLLEQAIQSLGVPSDMILGAGLLPEEPLELLENENFSTVNLRDLD